MDKKGFTLIEVLSTITIMTVIATMVCININKVFDNNDKEEENNNSIIEASACIYIELNKNEELKKECYTNGCDISTDILIKEGLLDKENVNNSKFIHIEIHNNEKRCTIKE